MDNNKVGRFIAKLRKKKGLTQDELGNMLGISGKSVSKWERGLNMPDISLIYKLSEVFDVDLNQLLNGEDAIKSVVDLQNEENAVNTFKDYINKGNSLIITANARKSNLIFNLYKSFPKNEEVD